MASFTKLRVGVVLPSLTAAAWEWALLKKIRESDCAHISLIVLVSDGSEVGNSGLDTTRNPLVGGIRALLMRANDLLENRTRLQPDALARCDVGDLVGGVPVIRLSQPRSGAQHLSRNERAALESHELDVIVSLASVPLPSEWTAAAKYGVWSLRHGDERASYGYPPGFWEIFLSTPVIASSLEIAASGADAHVVDRLFSPADPNSVRRCMNNVLWKAVPLIPRRLKELHGYGRAAFPRPNRNVHSAVPVRAGKRARPSAAQLAKHLAQMCARGLRDKVHDWLYLSQWILLFHMGETAPCMDLSQFRKIVPPKDRLWADPVAVLRGGKYYIFVEEVPFATNKGHISVIVMDPTGSHGPAVQVLERPYHLSYPFVFDADGQTYMIPESSSNRTVELYRCADFPTRWEFVTNLLADVCAVDATLLRYKGKWWLFANMAETPGSSTWDELYLFHADSLLGAQWSPHPLNPIVTDVTRARPAGPIFEKEGRLYRPGQDCSVRYGYGIRVHEITELSEHTYDEVEVASIMPSWDKKIIAAHMLAHAGALTVADALQPRSKL